jgi:hypothetical protein
VAEPSPFRPELFALGHSENSQRAGRGAGASRQSGAPQGVSFWAGPEIDLKAASTSVVELRKLA